MDNVLEKYGIQISTDDVEVGKSYPLYGMITDFIEDQPGEICVEINFSIKATMIINDPSKIELLKTRAFEPGIFVSKVTSKTDDHTTVETQTVVFGRRQTNFA